MSITDTSRHAYKTLLPKLNRRQKDVYEIFKTHPEGLTAAEANHYLGWTINRVTGRIQELRDEKKVIFDVGVRTCRKNKTLAHAYKILPAPFPEKPLPSAKEEEPVEPKTNQQELFA